jgi:hypothetical protein
MMERGVKSGIHIPPVVSRQTLDYVYRDELLYPTSDTNYAVDVLGT